MVVYLPFVYFLQVLPLFKNQRVESVLGSMIEPPDDSAVQGGEQTYCGMTVYLLVE